MSTSVLGPLILTCTACWSLEPRAVEEVKETTLRPRLVRLFQVPGALKSLKRKFTADDVVEEVQKKSELDARIAAAQAAYDKAIKASNRGKIKAATRNGHIF